ncbi:MAG: hypothetical protein RLZ55_1017 [Actinomycetota bacterium]|jgi:very-short-patch-repair endonuclease
MQRLRAELVALAETGKGVILTEDLRRHGFDAAERASAVRLLHPLRRGAYTVVEPENAESRHKLVLRTVLRQRGDRAVASHASAALLYGLPVPEASLDTVHIAVQDTAARLGVRNGVHTHASADVRKAISIASIPTTDAATTVLDCARSLPVVDAVAMLDAALNRRLVGLVDIRRRCDLAGGVPGIATARRVVGLADAGAESVGETRTRLILVVAGFDVLSQVALHDASGRFVGRVDLKLRDAPVVVEFDGRTKYTLQGTPASQHWREKLRADRIGNLGYQLVRVWWNRLADPAAIVADVERARDRALGGVTQTPRLGDRSDETTIARPSASR